MLLRTTNLSKYFGQVEAVVEVNLAVSEGEVLGIAGPNGAGKSTLFNLIAGVFPPSKGRIVFDGHDITHSTPHQICHLGLARTFQVPRTFASLSIYDNVRVAATFGSGYHVKPRREVVHQVLEFLGLNEMRHVPAKDLDLYSTKMVMLAAALATDCKLLLLDEPLGGLSMVEMAEFLRLVRKLNQERGLTVVMIEHILDSLMDISQRMVILHYGRVIYDGQPEGIREDKRVVEVYLGEGGDRP